jgi:hypothetical protein
MPAHEPFLRQNLPDRLVPRTIPVYGYVYDVRSEKLIEVPAATEIGASQA